MTFDFASGDLLLDIEAICARLSISRSTFERLRRNAPPAEGGFAPRRDDFEEMPPFPKPTLMLGRSPRWSAKVLTDWINAPRESLISQVERKIQRQLSSNK